MNKKLIIFTAIFIGALMILGAFWLTERSREKVEKEPFDVSQQESDGITEPETVTFTLEEVAIHDTAQDCWTAIGGSVYDITQYIPDHPGGDEILRACGTDGTTLFAERETDAGKEIGSGNPHSTHAHSLLGQFFLGSVEI